MIEYENTKKRRNMHLMNFLKYLISILTLTSLNYYDGYLLKGDVSK